jgi:molecular chaperone GrpE
MEPTTDTTTDQPPDPAARIAALEAENKDLLDRLRRVAADLDNRNKRVRQETQAAERRGREEILLDTLEMLDGLEQAAAALAGEADPRSVGEGVAMALRELQKNLGHHGLQQVPALGESFDPRVHEAIGRLPSAEAQPGTIVRELRKGYTMGGRLLRPARVLLASEDSAGAEPPTPATD